MLRLGLFAAAGSLLAASALGGAAIAANQRPVTAPQRPEAKATEIPLHTSSGPDTEQRELIFGARGVRNVTQATLTPVLPPANLATGAAVIVAPGGGFIYLSIDNEGYEVARWLAAHGIAAFVLKYRTLPTPRDSKAFGDLMAGMAKQIADPSNPPPAVEPKTPPLMLEDGQAAIRLVRSRATDFGIDPHRVGFLGFSAGAVLTMSVGSAQVAADRPDFLASLYGSPEAREVAADAPPLFFGMALDDPISARGQLGLVNSYRAAKRPIEAHFYASGGHGFGMNSKGAATALWPEEFYAWMKDRGVLSSPTRR